MCCPKADSRDRQVGVGPVVSGESPVLDHQPPHPAQKRSCILTTWIFAKRTLTGFSQNQGILCNRVATQMGNLSARSIAWKRGEDRIPPSQRVNVVRQFQARHPRAKARIVPQTTKLGN